MNSRAKALRRNQTDTERKLWMQLRDRQLGGFKFRRQHRLGPYIVDFACPEMLLVVEVDGGQHADRVDRDATRTAFLNSEGYRVLRFWDNDVLLKTEEVLEAILVELKAPHPNPLPAGGEREPYPSPFLPRRGEGTLA